MCLLSNKLGKYNEKGEESSRTVYNIVEMARKVTKTKQCVTGNSAAAADRVRRGVHSSQQRSTKRFEPSRTFGPVI